ncbi:MAG: transglycosylase domain-containing protein [Clostridiales Family XIII bacterium]|jgi:penicillin-binding protein 1A|nr:transglycosylase domain-containing protein [Clostridiales Family XIII bacterium]
MATDDKKNKTEENETQDMADYLKAFDKISRDFEKRTARPKEQPPGSGLRFSEKNTAASVPMPARPDAGISVPMPARPGAGAALSMASAQTNAPARSNRGGARPGGSADKHTKRKKDGKKKHRFHVGRFIFVVIVLLFIAGAVSGGLYVTTLLRNAPPIDPDDISSMLTQSSTLYDDAGQVIDNIYMGDGMRTNILYGDMPENLIDAFVAIEDKTFWTHHGFNLIRIMGAVRESLFGGGNISGTSTLTQQLARNLWLPDSMHDYDLRRKILEAYYSIQLENKLTKEQIIEAYLNTISMGNRSFGVQAASQAYFSKDVQELTLAECAALASLPKAPSRYALVQTISREDVAAEDPRLLAVGDRYAYLYNDAVESRKDLVLESMLAQDYIDQQEYDEALAVSLRDSVKPRVDIDNTDSNYFADYTVKRVSADLMALYDISEDEALNRIYNRGYRIYTTMNSSMQSIIENEFSDNSNFPAVAGLKKDAAGNILAANGNILLFSFDNFFDADGIFTLTPEEYEAQPDGSLKLLAGKRLNFYATQVQGATDYSVEFKDLYLLEDKTYYIIRGGTILIPQSYKTRDGDGNLILSSDFFTSDFYTENTGSFRFQDAGFVVGPGCYSMRQSVVQPQSAMVVLDYKTGSIKAMVGGRNTEGRLLYNRADSPRQPGSAIKPMAVYGPALQMGADLEPVVDGDASYGNYWTASSGIVDEAMTFQGNTWPKNWYTGYRGMQSLRKSIEQSVNVNAVKVQINIGPERSLRFLKKLGVTTVVETGDVNDMNPAALALGGMTHGISPLQMAAGYGAFGNEGLYVEPRPYSHITNRLGETIIAPEPYKDQAMDQGVAFLITNILHSTVTNGIASRAAIPSQPVAGKTGTTTEKCDAWFVGFTPQYSAALWIGNDVKLQLNEGSGAATRVWSKIMQQICDGTERGVFPAAPSNITSLTVDAVSGLLPSSHSATRSEYFIKGTEPTAVDTYSAPSYICPISGYLATPYCPARVLYSLGEDEENPNPRPRYYCHLHNNATETYPVDPEQTTNPDFNWDGILRDDSYYENLNLEEDGTDAPFTEGLPEDDAADVGIGPWPNPSTTADPSPPIPEVPPDDGTGESGQNAGQTQEDTEGMPDWLKPSSQNY